jgi:hypothetical protein
MNRAKALAAVDDAYAASFNHLFETLVTNLTVDDKDASAKFNAGIALRDEAHAIASAAVEKIFTE